MKISFVIPAHNCVVWLPHAVTSVLQQTYKDIELVVVDDGSTDRTGEYLDWLEKTDKTGKVSIIRLKNNFGRSEARNLGNKAATGDVICVLDADDLATPNRAEIVARKFAKDKPDYLYGAANVINALGRPEYIISADMINRDTCLSEDKNPKLQNRIVHSTVAYTKKSAMRYLYRNSDISKLGIDDWAMQVEALSDGAKFDFVDKRLACYRQLTTQVTKTRDEAAVMKAKRDFLASLAVTA